MSEEDVIKINHLLKSRSRRYIAAGKKEWLYPEEKFKGSWHDLRGFLLPPEDELWQYGGELFARLEDGSVYYQDAYGRKTPESDALEKSVEESDLGPNDTCGCGSGKKYKKCCLR